ncbi:MAG: hypothetical protein ABL857_04825, partial [Rickettsiales bacterium]
MFYQSSIANIAKLYRTVSTVAITAACLSFAFELVPSAAMASGKELPSVEVHFERINTQIAPDPFKNSPLTVAPPKVAPLKIVPDNVVQPKSPFLTKPSKPLSHEELLEIKAPIRKELPVKAVEKPKPKPVIKPKPVPKPKPEPVVPAPLTPDDEFTKALTAPIVKEPAPVPVPEVKPEPAPVPVPEVKPEPAPVPVPEAVSYTH